MALFLVRQFLKQLTVLLLSCDFLPLCSSELRLQRLSCECPLGILIRLFAFEYCRCFTLHLCCSRHLLLQGTHGSFCLRLAFLCPYQRLGVTLFFTRELQEHSCLFVLQCCLRLLLLLQQLFF